MENTKKNILLDCRDASLGYEGKPVWEHLTFQVRSGDYLCIVGENGSGKSTLLKSLLGLLKPLSGEIVHADTLRGGSIGYLPQQTRAQKDFPATVTEVVRSGFISGKGMRFFYTAQEKSRALMILDEPVTGLDPAAAQDLYRTLEYLNKKEGIAIVMVTHDIQNALQYATAILHAGHGQWFYGTTAEYLASPWGKRFGGEGK